MADKEQTPPPLASAAIDTTSSPLTPNPKRARMSSPDPTVENSVKDSKIVEKEGAKEKVNEESGEKKEVEEASVSTEKAAEHEQHESTESAGVLEADVTSSEQLAEEGDLEAV